MNMWAQMGADDVGTCRSHSHKNVASMRDNSRDGYDYGCVYFILKTINTWNGCGASGHVMMKNKSYVITGGERRYTVLRGFLEKTLDPQPESMQEK